MKTKKLLTLVGIIWLVVIVVAVSLMAACTKPASEPVSAAEFYRDNTITMIVGFNPGGATDLGARLVAAFWAEATDGTVKVENMPGGGSILSANTVYDAKPDGLTFGVWQCASLATPVLFKEPGITYDLSKMTYLGAYGLEPSCLALGSKCPYKSIADLQKAKGLKFAVPTQKLGIILAQGLHAFGIDAKIIYGYASAPEIGLACARGEIDGGYWSASACLLEIGKGFVQKPLYVLDTERHPSFPDTPAIVQLIQPTGFDKQFLDFCLGLVEGRLLYGPPNIPEDRVKFVRDALIKINEMDGFKQMAKPHWGVVLRPIPGEEVDKIMADLLATPDSLIKQFLEVTNQYTALSK